MRRTEDAVSILVFLLLLSSPLAAQLAGLELSAPPLENRLPAPMPEIEPTRERIAAFPDQFEAYYSDHFGLRNTLIRWHAIVKVLWLRTSSASNVTLGRDGWLFLNGAIFGRDQIAIQDYCGAVRLAPRQLSALSRDLEGRRAWLNARGIRYLWVVAPNKHSVYGEYLPDSVRPLRGRSLLDQIVGHLATHTSVEVVDLRAPLIYSKPSGRLYDKTGTHWNGRGAFIADGIIASRLSRWFPAIEPLSSAGFERTETHRGGAELAQMLSLPDILEETALGLVPRTGFHARRSERDPHPPARKLYRSPYASERSAPELPRAVIFHDSFVLALEDFLSEHFSRAAYYWQYDFDREVIEAERPDIVIQLLAERSLLPPPTRP